MSDGGRRASDVEPPDPLLDRAITNRRALVLAQVLEPGLGDAGGAGIADASGVRRPRFP